MYILLVLLLLLLFFFIPLKFDISVNRLKESDLIIFSVSIYFFKVIKIELDYMDLILYRHNSGLKYNIVLKYVFPILLNKNRKKQLSYYEIKQILNKATKLRNKYSRVIEYILNKLYINKIEIFMRLGLNDAAVTAVFIGFLYAIIDTILSLISSHIRFIRIPVIKIEPSFNELKLDLFARGIITIRLGHIIIGGILILLGGLENERTSNRGFNEDHHGKFKRYG